MGKTIPIDQKSVARHLALQPGPPESVLRRPALAGLGAVASLGALGAPCPGGERRGAGECRAGTGEELLLGFLGWKNGVFIFFLVILWLDLFRVIHFHFVLFFFNCLLDFEWWGDTEFFI